MSGGEVIKPDIVFFMVDQLSAKWLDAACDGVVPVPNIERLKARGTTFTNVITSNPVCMPARSTLATGLTTRGHGVLENGYRLDPDLPTFMQALRKAGRRTGAFGKVHLLPHFAGVRPDYEPYGFEVTHITEDSRGGEWLDWVEKEHPEHYESVLATIWPSKIPDFAEYGPNKVNLRERIERVRKEFKWATPEFPLDTSGRYTLPFPEGVSQTNWITGHALDFLKDTPRDRPLYAHVSYVQPHSPFSAPADYMRLVDVDRIPEPVPAEWAADPHAPEELRRRKPNIPDDWRYARQLYFADIAHLDRQLGRVMDCFDETGRLDDAFVIFLADHGEMLFDHGLTGKEEKHYDACIRVPLLVAGPGLARGQVRDDMVQLEDICPTVLDMAGVKLPPMPRMGPYLKLKAEDIPVLPGRSLVPLCRGEEAGNCPGRKAAYSESYNHINSAHPGQWARTIRTKEWRYTFYPDGGGEQLFDLASDPDEQRNLVAEPGHAATRQELRDRLMELIVMQDYPKTRRELFALGVH